jgi:hypothetical protein
MTETLYWLSFGVMAAVTLFFCPVLLWNTSSRMRDAVDGWRETRRRRREQKLWRATAEARRARRARQDIP